MSKDIEASKKFLESERSQPQAGSSSAPPPNLADLLVKCFCGVCETWFQRKNIEYALKSNGEEILRDNESRNILRKFALYRRGTSIFKTTLEEILDCFELCLAIMSGEKELEENRDDLEDLCFTEYWENQLSTAVDEGTTEAFLQDLMRESAIRLENLEEYAIFKDELKKKLKIN